MRNEIVEEIKAARKSGVVHCGVLERRFSSVERLAMKFGLSRDSSSYVEIEESSAQELVRLILSQDLAYGATIVEEERASVLAKRFFDELGGQDVRFYSNTVPPWQPGQNGTGFMASWRPATAATFDTGVLAVGSQRSGCVWVEDED